jgi:Zn-dependent protease with chaperone function
MSRSAPLIVATILLLATPAARAGDEVKLDGYAEFRDGAVLVVDGQRVRLGDGAEFKGRGEARSFATIPLGFEVKVRGRRLDDGTVLARKVEAKQNGAALFEAELVESFNQVERSYRERQLMFEPDGAEYGPLVEDGPEVERVRRITRRLVPPYLQADDFRVYVVRNDEWNAMAAPNRSIYVFSGLLDDMDDDEVAIILGHELAHATHEHSRRAFKRALLVQLAAVGAAAVAEETVEGEGKKQAIQVAALLGASAWVNGYGRGHEDQADRVGLRYAWEGGYDVARGPGLWRRFADRYGNTNKVVNFFFGNHSVARDRERNLNREIGFNYRDRTRRPGLEATPAGSEPPREQPDPDTRPGWGRRPPATDPT